MKFLILLIMPILLFGQNKNWTDSSGWVNQEADGPTGYPVFMDEFHHKIHEGEAFEISGYLSMGSGDTSYFFLQAPSAKKIHMLYDINATKLTTMNVYFDCDSIPSSATAITPRNMDDNSANAATLTVKYVSGNLAPSVYPTAAFGTIVDSTKIGATGAAPSAKFGGNSGRDAEKILKVSTIYCYEIISGDATNTFNFWVPFYENTDKY